MKISEFIEKLKAFQAEHGDLPVELNGQSGLAGTPFRYEHWDPDTDTFPPVCMLKWDDGQ